MGHSATPLLQLATMESEIEQVDRWAIGAGAAPLYDLREFIQKLLRSEDGSKLFLKGISGLACSRGPIHKQQGIPMGIVVQLSSYTLDRIRDDGEFNLYRAHAQRIEAPSVLLLAPVTAQPSPQGLNKIDHEFSSKSGTGFGPGGAARGPFRTRRVDWSGSNQILQLVI